MMTASGKGDTVKGDSIEGFTLLHKAVFHSEVDKLKRLLERKEDDTVTRKPFDVNARCILKQTPLILCVRQHYLDDKKGKGEIMCKMLLDHGASVMEDGKLVRDAYGDTTLHLAGMSSFRNGVGMMKLLIEKVSKPFGLHISHHDGFTGLPTNGRSVKR